MHSAQSQFQIWILLAPPLTRVLCFGIGLSFPPSLLLIRSVRMG